MYIKVKDIKASDVKFKRGFTLVETIVAITLIVVVSAFALSSVTYTEKLSDSNSAKVFFMRELDCYIQCYISDGFDLSSGSALAFYLGDGFYCDDNSGDGKTTYSFFYDGDFKLIASEEKRDQTVFMIVADVYSGGGFKAGAMRVKSGQELIFAMKEIFYREADYGV